MPPVMTSVPGKIESDTTPPVLDRALLFIACPALVLLVLFLFSLVSAAGEKISDASLSFFPSLWMLGISTGLLSACIGLLCWRMASFRHDRNAHVREASMQRRTNYFEEMLHLTLNSIPNPIFISDRDGRVWFANTAAGLTDKETADLTGKTLEHIFPPEIAQLTQERIRRAESVKAPVITLDRRDEIVGGSSYFETYHIPLPETAELHNTVLVMEKDITSIILERERQEQIFQQLVDVMIALIDRRDPYAAGHSLRVGSVAASLAQHMELDDSAVEACRVAGSLMNLGKVMVPREVLIKVAPLMPDELKLIRKAILASADILSLISFEAPVIPTLRQVLERYDGTGAPEGRKGENILLTARIVALSNALVALVSPRAHRPGMSIDDAFKILEKDSGAAFDPRLVKELRQHLTEHPEVQDILSQPAPELKGAAADMQG
jgi:PAS domain S-box-containing protein